MLRILNFFTLVLIGLAATASFGLSEPFPASPENSVFGSDEILNVELDAPLQDLFIKNDANTKDEKVFVAGKLSYWDHRNKKVSLNVRVRVKGKSTVSFCPFKKMEIKFKGADTSATIFANITSIDLNTHCAEPGELDELEAHFSSSYFNHREVLIYKMAKILRVPTYQARALSIRYKNTGLKVDNSSQPYNAFFLEDHGDLTKRLHARDVKVQELRRENERMNLAKQAEISVADLYRAALFNGLIANRDWGYPQDEELDVFHNLKVLEIQPGKWVPLIYDFNLSPIVTQDKVYPFFPSRFVLDENIKAQVLATFKEKRTELYALLETLKNDQPAYTSLKICLDEFFKNE